MARVIGIDFGNWMTYVCSVKKMDEETHIGGNIEDLISEKYNLRGSAGIPNVFYWNATSNNGVLKFAEEKGFSVKEEAEITRFAGVSSTRGAG